MWQTLALNTNHATSADTLNINGSTMSVAANTGAATIADTINALGNGVTAEAYLSTTISGITAASTSTINLEKGTGTVDSYDLSTYGGDSARLAEDMQADGYDAVYDVDTDTIHFKATDVDGIDTTGANDASGFMIGGTAVGTTSGSLSVSSELNLSSANKIGITGTTADQLFGTGANNTAIASTGGNSALTSVESLDISGITSDGAQAAIKAIDAALAQIDESRAGLGAVQKPFFSYN